MSAPHELNDEAGFSLMELLIVIVLMGIITGAITTAFITSIKANRQVATVIPGPQASQSLASWLKSDIESAIPSSISTAAGTGTGCSALVPAETVGAVNVLYLETKDYTGATTETYSSAYRFRTDGSLWRVWCRKGQAPIVQSAIISNLPVKPVLPAVLPACTAAPATPPVPCAPTAVYTPAQNKIAMYLVTTNKAVNYSFSLTATVRLDATTTTAAADVTTTKVPHDACSYLSATILPSPVITAGPGNSPSPLTSALSFVVQTTGQCTDPISDTNPDPGAVGVQLSSGETFNLVEDPTISGRWTGTFTSTYAGWQKGNYAVTVLDAYVPGDPDSPGYQIPGPVLTLKVDKP